MGTGRVRIARRPGALVTLYTTPLFRAETRLLIGEGPHTPEVGGADKVNGDENGMVIDAETLTQMVRNRALTRDVIERQTLWKSPEFAPYVATATTDDQRAIGLVDPFLSRLKAAIVPDSKMMVVAFEANDPDLAARTVNDVATRFIERDRESRFAAANTGADWLDQPSGRATSAGGVGRGGIAELPGQPGRHVAVGSAEHRRPEAL